jgi:hypothetical protein
MTKPKSPAALRREVERLTAQVRALHLELATARRHYAENLSDLVDYKTRAEQAIRILQGADE